MNLFAPFNSDGYKLGHAAMYAQGTESVYSNLTPRSDRLYRCKKHPLTGETTPNCTRYYDGKLVVVGCQGAIIEVVENWNKFFDMDKGIAIARFKLLCDNYLGPNIVSVDELSKLHDLGFLPLEIKTLDEGSKVNMGIPVLTITNTIAHAYWLVNFLETTISNLTWKTATSATIATEYRAMLKDFAIRTGTPLEIVDVQAHDFSARGMSGPEDAARTGFGPLAAGNLGTDSLGAVLYAQEYYGGGEFVGCSVPATEHAVATSNILRIESELTSGSYHFVDNEHGEIFSKMVANSEDLRLIAEVMFLYELMLRFPTGILSYVTDSFDFWAMISQGLPYLKDVIMRREGNGITPGKLVIRPDSGDPADVICGLTDFEGRTNVSEAEFNGAIRTLAGIFGTTNTETGHCMLDEHIGLIYGDSITTQRCLDILERLDKMGYASGNVMFGVGSYTFQCVTRDTFAFAVKATNTVVNGKSIAIFKDPKTDSKKKSAKGLLCVGYDDSGELVLSDDVSPEEEATGLLIRRFYNGQFFNMTTVDEIRARLK